MEKSSEAQFKEIRASIEAQAIVNFRLFEALVLMNPPAMKKVADLLEQHALLASADEDFHEQRVGNRLAAQIELFRDALLRHESAEAMREVVKQARKPRSPKAGD
jgi:hypothetical protein